jgi:hypothetical protein
MARALIVTAFALALAWAPQARAEEAVALIWKGSKNKADVESLEPSWKQLETLQADSHEFKLSEGRMLRVLTYEESSEPEGDEPGDSYTRTHYLFALTDKSGALLDTGDVVGQERFSGDVRKGPSGYLCHVSEFDRDKSGVVEFVRSCSATVAECGSVVSRDEVTRFTVSGDSLTSSELHRNEQRVECEAD